MNKWILSVEFFSLVLILILLLNVSDKKWNRHPRHRLYQVCLWMSVWTVAMNILCTFTIAWVWHIPLWVNWLFNSAYFLMIVGLSSLIAYYIAGLIFEHVYNPRGLRMVGSVLGTMCALYALLLIYNVVSGVVFYFDGERVYHRGPLINAGYLVLGLEIILLIVCSVINRNSLSLSVRRVMRLLPPAVFLLTVYQLFFPDVLFNGGILVTGHIILLYNFQSRRLEQDDLTDVGTRSSFYQELSLRLAGCQQFQVIVVSLRRFHEINYRYGHQKGDTLLYEAASWLQRLHRDGAAFRLSNVSFCLLLPYENERETDRILDAVRRRFMSPWCMEETEIQLDCCFAELTHIDQTWNATDVVEFINYSLMEAAGQKNRLIRFDSSVFNRMEQRNRLLQLLHRAVQERRFQVWYQPIYNVETGAFVSAEALVRMWDENGKAVPPSLFIPLAEQSNLIGEISHLVLEQVCRLLGSGQLPADQTISVNLSMQQLTSDRLAEELQECLERYGANPRQLKLEITERVLTEEPVRMQQIMEKIARMGVEFYLDDFGTGYSNLSVVLGSRLSGIKLDQSLIRMYPDHKRSAAIVNTMLTLFHAIGCRVVAEGVETPRQAQALQEKGADWLQGYYYAKPMPEQSFAAFVRKSSVSVRERP